MPSILAGIKTAAVINVGTATLGALIGAGGYGQPILTGIRLDDTRLILEGAMPAALLALAVQGLFELVERLVVSRGLRMRPPSTTTTEGACRQPPEREPPPQERRAEHALAAQAEPAAERAEVRARRRAAR